MIGKPITAQELIERLKTFPADATVKVCVVSALELSERESREVALSAAAHHVWYAKEYDIVWIEAEDR